MAGAYGRVRAAGRASSAASIVRIPRDEPLPLSSAQERLWFLHRLDPSSTAYHLGIELTLDGALDVAKLESSLTALIARHEILRTIYPDDHGKPRQVVLPATRFDLATVDLAEAPDREAAAREYADTEMRRKFDLANEPLFRATLQRLGLSAHRYRRQHTSSPMAGRTAFSFANSARLHGRTLPALPFQYADFAAWQRAQDRDERSLDYWRQQLAGPLPELDLPTLTAADATPARLAAAHPFVIAAEVAEALRQLGRREGATLFMTLLAAFNALLARCSGQDDIVIGTPVANRARGGSGDGRSSLESLIGFFVNTIVLRSDLSADPDFRELLRRTRRTVLDAFEHQALPFEQLVSVLAPERRLHRQPLFRAMFALQNAPVNHCRCRGLAVTTRIPPDAAIFDLAVQVEETAGGLAADQYDTVSSPRRPSARSLRISRDPRRRRGRSHASSRTLPVSLAREVADDDVRLTALEAALLDDPAVADAAVLARRRSHPNGA